MPSPRSRRPPREDSLAPTAPAVNPLVLEWDYRVFAGESGASGLYVTDLDGDGKPEIVAAPISNYWYTAACSAGSCEITWASPLLPAPVDSLRVMNVDDDPAPEVIVVAGDSIYVYDGATKALERQFQVEPYVSFDSLNVADVDGDGRLEFVFSTNEALYVHDAETGELKWSARKYWGSRVRVANVDDDPGLEIVVTPPYDGAYVLDGRTHAVKWHYAPGFDYGFELADVDGDGKAEIVAATADAIQVFDADLHSLARTIATSDTPQGLRVRDVDGDGGPEMVFRAGSIGDVVVLDAVTGATRWTFTPPPWAPDFPSYGVTGFAAGELGDGQRKLVFSGANDRLHVVDVASHALYWRNEPIYGPFFALAHGDVDGDGAPEILYASFQSTNSEFLDGRLFVRDARTKALEFAKESTTGRDWEGVHRVVSANVDEDPQQEIFVTTSDLYTPIVICYDGLSHAEQWRRSAEDGVTFESLAVADLDRDGDPELVVGGEGQVSGTYFHTVYVYDAATGAEKWRTPPLPANSLSLLRVADFDGDGRPEILVGGMDTPGYGNGDLYLVNPRTRTARPLGIHPGMLTLDAPDLDGDGVAEIVIGTAQGDVQLLDPQTGDVRSSLGSFGGKIEGVRFADFSGDGVSDIVLVMDDRLFIYDGRTGLCAGSTPVLGYDVALDDSLVVADIDGDGRLEVMVNVGQAIQVYEIRTGLALAQTAPAGPFEVTDSLTYTLTVANLDGLAATAVMLTDTLPTGVDLGSASASQGSCAPGPIVSCDLGTLEPGAAATIEIQVTVRQPGVSLVNTATVTRAEPDDYPANDTSIHTARVLDLPKLKPGSAALKEPATGVAYAVVPVTLSRPSRHALTVSYSTENGTASAGADYVAVAGTLTFRPGSTRQEVRVPVRADSLEEPNESLTVILSGDLLADVPGRARVTIIDRPPRVRAQ
jgi:uncharacterized repeat protein (TIGR01451 family)